MGMPQNLNPSHHALISPTCDLVPVSLVEHWSCEDDDVEGDAETVEAGEGGHQPTEAGLEVEGRRGDHSQRH